MNSLKTLVAVSLIVLVGRVAAQINIPAGDLTFAGTGYNATLTLGGVNVGPVSVGPFKIINPLDVTVTGGGSGGLPTTAQEQATISHTSLWFCMDPLQPWKVSGTGSLIYGSTNYANFDQNFAFGTATTGTSASAQLADSTARLTGGISEIEYRDLQTLFALHLTAAKATDAAGLLAAAALQLAIWEVVNECNAYNPVTNVTTNPLTGLTHYSLDSGGNFSASSTSSTLINTANGYLSVLNNINAGTYAGGRPMNAPGHVDFLIDGSQNGTATQDYVGWEEPVPEASTYGLAAMGLMGLVVAARIRRQRAN